MFCFGIYLSFSGLTNGVYRDMANIDVAWEVEGVITPEESVTALIKVIESKGIQHSGTFWTWENKVGSPL